MTQLAIRRSGGASIISIPKTILELLDLHVGSKLELHLEGRKIVLIPASEQFSLQSLLEGSPKERLQIIDEDHEWLNDQPVGKEI